MPISWTRRGVIRSAVAGWMGALAPARRARGGGTAEVEPIPALRPRGPGGAQFLLMSDCCSGIPGSPGERNLARVNAVVRRLRPLPTFIAFPGDAVAGYTKDREPLRSQWRHWYEHEMRWLAEAAIPLYQSTSNHNTYDAMSEGVFREFHAGYPQNGPESSRGLDYAVRKGDLLYVSVHEPSRPHPERPGYRVDVGWIDRVLEENRDAAFKFVAGHYPALPINGYSRYPTWTLFPAEREAFWAVLVKHGVTAYLASHVIAFDVRVRQGVLQVVSAGAGTNYGPGGGMPGRTEYLHATQVAVDREGLRYQVLDVEGRLRESLSWPIDLPPVGRWEAMPPRRAGVGILAFRCRGILGGRAGTTRTLVCGDDPSEGPLPVWIGFEGRPARLVVRLVPEPGFGSQEWSGPVCPEGQAFDLVVAIHPGMGPGGLLYRAGGDTRWSSLETDSAKGAETLHWPVAWVVGRGPSGDDDRPFGPGELQVTWTWSKIPDVSDSRSDR